MIGQVKIKARGKSLTENEVAQMVDSVLETGALSRQLKLSDGEIKNEVHGDK